MTFPRVSPPAIYQLLQDGEEEKNREESSYRVIFNFPLIRRTSVSVEMYRGNELTEAVD